MTSIAEAAKVPRGSVSNHFSIGELIETLVDAEIEREITAFKAVLLTPQGLPLTRLRSFITERTTSLTADEARQGWLLADLLAQATGEYPRVQKALDAFFQNLRDALVHVLTAVSLDHAMAPGFRPDRAAELIVNVLVGARLCAKSAPTANFSSPRELILAGILGKPTWV